MVEVEWWKRKRYQSEKQQDKRKELRRVWKERRTQYKEFISEAKKKCLTDKLDNLCENECWNRVWEALMRLGSGKGKAGIWCNNATYTTEQAHIDDNLLKKYHPRCSDE